MDIFADIAVGTGALLAAAYCMLAIAEVACIYTP